MHGEAVANGELASLVGWVRPYLLEHIVVKLARSLRGPIKTALCLSGPELPLKVTIDDSDAGQSCTHRILVEPDDASADDSVRLLLVAAGSDEVQAERTVRWDGDPANASELIGAIRELAGLDATT